MAQQKPTSADAGDSIPQQPQGDPWHAFGYLSAGVFVYGLIGWGLDRWLGTTFLVAIGILVGAGFGIYMTWARFRQPPTDQNL
ncbi:MAG: AtpZ/AtpI family protein [Nocardioides sp.]|nr:AtpZ/AtpI family protein [Nocardioides sp.]